MMHIDEPCTCLHRRQSVENVGGVWLGSITSRPLPSPPFPFLPSLSLCSHPFPSSPQLLPCSVPRHRLSTYGRRAFAVAGPAVWNSLPEDMRDPDVSEDSYRQSLKTFLFSQYRCVQRIWGYFTRMRYINLHLTLTLTLEVGPKSS